MISGRNIVVLSSLDWHSLWQAPQEIASRLGRAGNSVLYVENLGIRAPRLGDATRIASRVRARVGAVRAAGVRGVAPGVHACSPLVLPPFGGTHRRGLNRRLFLPSIRRAAESLGTTEALLWTFLPTDTALDVVEMLRGQRGPLVYTCLADFSQLADRPDSLERAERELLRSADVVFARGPDLAARCRQWADEVHEFQLGVSLDAFADGSPSEADQRAAGARPVIGYVGALHRYFDSSLAAAAARARPDWRWVYVGPIHAPVEELAALPNVELLGEQAHERLVEHVRSFDVCTIPYRVVAATETIMPAKLLEYLAVGKPVVSTPLPDVIGFDAERNLVEIADADPARFLEAIERARLNDDDESRAARRRAVTGLDWGAQLERMCDTIERVAARTSRPRTSSPAPS